VAKTNIKRPRLTKEEFERIIDLYYKNEIPRTIVAKVVKEISHVPQS